MDMLINLEYAHVRMYEFSSPMDGQADEDQILMAGVIA